MTDEIIDNFESILRTPIRGYIANFVQFSKYQFPNIVNYYQGKLSTPDTESFSELETLLHESKELSSLIQLNNYRFNSYGDWELVDQLDEIRTKLETFDNLSRWLRSSITKNDFSPNVEMNIVLRKSQTLEGLSKEVGYKDSQNGWVNVALNNQLTEEDYTPSGGNLLKFSFQNNLNLTIESVVDNMQGEKVYGLDLDKKMTFEDDDLKVLSYRDTIFQAFGILMTLKRNDNPEFPEDGVQSNLAVGNNIRNVSLPIIFRQLSYTFSKDDTFKELQILDFRREEDQLLLVCQAKTRLEETLPTLSVVV